MKNLKTLSLYTTSGEIAGTTYYRIYQYLDNERFRIRKCPRLTNEMYRKWMPISHKNLIFKILVFILLYLRTFYFLLRDCICPPDTIVVSRSILTKILPPSFKIMIKYLKRRGVDFIWDFDDDIIATGEMRETDFNWFCEIPSYIVVASDNNLRLLPAEVQQKCIKLPTTDRDMYQGFSESLVQHRLKSLNIERRIVWVGSAVSLPFLIRIMPAFEEYAATHTQHGIKVRLTVVCNKPLKYSPVSFDLENVKWTREKAIESMRNAHIGIMPLPNTRITQGKGGFKLIQYLSIGLPIIGSPIGINNQLITSDVGVKADIENMSAWVTGLNKILAGEEAYIQFSKNAFAHWMKEYSYPYNLDIWLKLIEGNHNN